MKTVMKWVCVMALAHVALAQDDKTSLYFYSGGNLAYVCSASVVVGPIVNSQSDGGITNIIVSSSVGTVTTSDVHGLWVGAVVTISGSSTSALNGKYIVATVPSTTTYTIATAGVANATYTTGLVATTNSPTTGSPVWRIKVYKYVAGVLDSVTLGGGSLSLNYRAKCSDRSLY